MPFRDLLKKRDKIQEDEAPAPEPQRNWADDPPVFTFLRTDTHTQEIISPPSFSSAESNKQLPFSRDNDDPGQGHLSTRHSRSPSASSQSSDKSKTKSTKRLSQRLHLRRSDPSSPNVPEDLPDIAPAVDENGDPIRESLWEKRATILAMRNGEERSRPATPVGTMADVEAFANMSRSSSHRASPGVADVNIQEAIRLHEAGDLVNSTRIFAQLADPNGENDPLSQVLYGLALRYVTLPRFPMQAAQSDHIQGCSALCFDPLNGSDTFSTDTDGDAPPTQRRPSPTSQLPRRMRPPSKNSH